MFQVHGCMMDHCTGDSHLWSDFLKTTLSVTIERTATALSVLWTSPLDTAFQLRTTLVIPHGVADSIEWMDWVDWLECYWVKPLQWMLIIYEVLGEVPVLPIFIYQTIMCGCLTF